MEVLENVSGDLGAGIPDMLIKVLEIEEVM